MEEEKIRNEEALIQASMESLRELAVSLQEESYQEEADLIFRQFADLADRMSIGSSQSIIDMHAGRAKLHLDGIVAVCAGANNELYREAIMLRDSTVEGLASILSSGV